ncbi:MAG: hypothetical protein M3362_18940 [Acidobacteriota bacterium]|nr:hypothetical protein [Acidobacteriota bacterium]
MRTQTEILKDASPAGSKVKLFVAIVAGAYFLWAAVHPDEWRMIDGVNLVIHEAGHLFFKPLGEFLMIAGGSLLQVIVPLVFAGYFFLNRKYFSCSLVLFWVGESLLNVSVYAADSVLMQLPLLGGNDSIHDWNYMLDRLGLLGQTAKVAFVIRALGTLFIITAIAWAIHASRTRPKSESKDIWKNF